MTPDETVAQSREALLYLGRSFMMDPATYRRGHELGFTGFDFYAAGRLGVLGPVDAAVAAACAVFIHPDGLRAAWESGLAVMPLEQTVGHFAEACRDWGRARYADDAETARLADLLERLVDHADGYGRALFAGWRAVPRCADAPGRVSQAVHTLRERRGGSHDIAILGQGLSPMEAMAARGDLGRQSTAYFGWPEPYPDGAPFRARWEEAERITDALEAPVFAVLEAAEREELVGLLRRAHEQALAVASV